MFTATTTIMKFLLFSLLCFLLSAPSRSLCEEKAVIVGVTSVLSGDLGVLGRNIVDTSETYRKHFLRHELEFVYEDSKLNGAEGLAAYQKLIAVSGADFLIAGSSTSGTMAAAALINSAKVPAISVVTGGSGIDRAGPWIFRIGNSDIIDGVQEAEAFTAQKCSRVALLTEETEYTQDISGAFRPRFETLGGKLAFDQDFIPGTRDFKSTIAAIKRLNPDGVFVVTQTGTPLGIFMRQWQELKGPKVPIHTTFVAAPNPDAHEIAGAAMDGVYYMAPDYDRNNPRLKDFLEKYHEDHGKDPPIIFHTAGTVDALDMLQIFLDEHPAYDKEKFAAFLSGRIKDYHGLMGVYSFDAEGNSNLGFRMERISAADVTLK